MASTPMTSHPPTPERIFDTLLAHQQAAALRAALDLDVFTASRKGAGTIPCSRERDEHPSEVYAFSAITSCQRAFDEDSSAYGLTQESATFLDQRSPAYIGGDAALPAFANVR